MATGRHDLIVQGPEVGNWVAKRVHGRYHMDDSAAIGLYRGELVAGVIYENFNGKSVTCHIACQGHLTREYLGEIFRYAFVRMGVEKILAPVASVNHRSRNFVSKMGFIPEARITDAHPQGDLYIYTMKRDRCRFLGEKYGKRH